LDWLLFRSFDLRYLNPISSDDIACPVGGLNANSAIMKKARVGLFGCAIVETSNKVPLGEEVAEPLWYQDLENNTTLFNNGHVFYGAQADSIREFKDYLRQGMWQDLLSFMRMIPLFGDGVEFSVQLANKCEENKQCDLAAVIFAINKAAGTRVTRWAKSVQQFLQPMSTTFLRSRAALTAETTLARAAGREVSTVGSGQLAKTMSQIVNIIIGKGTTSVERIAEILNTKYSNDSVVFPKVGS
jgi:hypothetical protein